MYEANQLAHLGEELWTKRGGQSSRQITTEPALRPDPRNSCCHIASELDRCIGEDSSLTHGHNTRDD